MGGENGAVFRRPPGGQRRRPERPTEKLRKQTVQSVFRFKEDTHEEAAAAEESGERGEQGGSDDWTLAVSGVRAYHVAAPTSVPDVYLQGQ